MAGDHLDESGSDDRWSEALAASLEAADNSAREAVLARYAEFASRLADFYARRARVERWAAPLRSAVQGGPPAEQQADTCHAGEALGDFRIFREVGRGGMGIVYEAEQLSLGRRVALKVLPFAATMDPRKLQRFQNEARAAASLEHTHIVPVYGVGCARGVHYYAMKFIDGQSLAEIIAARNNDGRMTNDEALSKAPEMPQGAIGTQIRQSTLGPLSSFIIRDSSFFRTVAELGTQVAEALEHAHSLGIVHRDIKPANLMIDGNGSLWVTDFGLARTAADAGLTMTGDVLGTLRYMSPEQALAKHGLVDHRTDVYSLGVTLYELLTGKPAVDGKDREEILNSITLEEPRAPRALDAAIPHNLETIVLKAMEKNPADRYVTAKELADDLRHYLEDRPIRARRAPLSLRLRKWGRRHRPVVASLAAGILTLLGVGVVLAVGYQRRLMQTEQGMTAALVQAETLMEDEDRLIAHPERWQTTSRLAQAALEKAEELLAVGPATESLAKRVEVNRTAVEAALADSGLLIELNRIRLERSTIKDGRFHVTQPAALYAKALGDYGLDLAAPESAVELIRSSRLHEVLLSALEDWWLIAKDDRERQQLEHLLQASASTDLLLARWRKAAHRSDGAALVKMAAELAKQRLPSAVVCSRAADLRWLKEWAAAERMLKAAQARDPGDFWLNHDLGMVIQEQGPTRAEEAVGYLRAALALRSDNPAVHVNLGLALEDMGDFDGAIGCCSKAIELDPNFAFAHNNLGVLLVSKGKLDEAIVCFQRAIALEPIDPLAHDNLGHALTALGKFDEAIESCKRAIDIDPGFCKAYFNLGNALQSSRKFEEAIAWYKKALDINPNDAGVYCNLGGAFRGKGSLYEAIACLKKSVGLQPDRADFHSNLAALLLETGQLDEAVTEARVALRLDKDYPEARCHLGLGLQRLGLFAEALEELKRGHALGTKNPSWRYPSAQWLRTAEQLVALENKLPRLVNGEAQTTDAAERLAAASMCQNHKKLYRAASRFYAEAFATQPGLAENLRTQDRYNAACAAALAGCGEGKDAAGIDGKERARLRQQAMDWLRADLAAYRRMPDEKAGPMVREQMEHWQQDTDFAGVRGAALSKLPTAEQQAWQNLWADVADTLTSAKGKTAPAKKSESK
jgi:serine/threonine protein kinase/Flp pilus assembly protein TadD